LKQAIKYDLDLVFHALSDPTRRAILNSLIQNRERGVSDIASAFPMSLAAVSKHIKVMEKAKLVARRKEGSFSYLMLNAEAVLSADQWMERYRQYWNSKLDSLKELLEKDET
jgi:DNA-binding transcriptional ArsR family regulator